MAYRNLLLSLEGRVAVLTVNRPEVRNALDGATVAELHRALGEVRTARSTVLILTGAGDKAFVSGADIRGLRDRRRDDALASMNSRLMTEVEIGRAHPKIDCGMVVRDFHQVRRSRGGRRDALPADSWRTSGRTPQGHPPGPARAGPNIKAVATDQRRANACPNEKRSAA